MAAPLKCSLGKCRPATHSRFISRYRFCTLRIWPNTDFFEECQKVFFSHTDSLPEILIFLVTYTDFVLDQSGRSEVMKGTMAGNACGGFYVKRFRHFFVDLALF